MENGSKMLVSLLAEIGTRKFMTRDFDIEGMEKELLVVQCNVVHFLFIRTR